MVQEARLLDTEFSDDASSIENAPVGSESEDDDNFFTFESTLMTSSTAEDEIQKYLQDPDKTLGSLKAYPMIRAVFLNTTSHCCQVLLLSNFLVREDLFSPHTITP